MIALYHSPASAHSASVRIVLAEKQLPFASHELDLAGFDQHAPEFLAINPGGMVPVLEDGGHRLTEAFFILLYLDELYPDPPLAGADPQTRYAVRKWGKYVETHIAPHLAIVRWAERGGQLDEQRRAGFDRLTPERRPLWKKAAAGFDAEEVSVSRKALHRAVARIEQDLERGPWLAGADYTLADAAVFPHVQQFAALGIELPAAVEEWRSRVAERPSVREAAGAIEPVPTMGPERGRWG